MQRFQRSAVVALMIAALVVVPRARAADSISTQRRTPAAPYTPSRRPVPEGHTLLAPSFQFEGIWMLNATHADPPAENRPRGPSPMARVIQPAKKLVIEMQADQVNVSEDGHVPRAYAMTDSLKPHQHERLTENTSARWKSGGLEMTQAMGPRGKLVETYTLSHDGETLTIRARREGGREGGREGLPNPVITRVYTRYDGK